MNKITLLKKVAKIKKTRDEACKYGMVGLQQSCNYEIARIAKKLKVDYYSIA